MKLANISIGSRVIIMQKSPHPTGAPVHGTVREINCDAEGNPTSEAYAGKLIGVELDEHYPNAHCLTPTEEKDERGKIKRDAQGHALGAVANGHGWYTRPEWLAPETE